MNPDVNAFQRAFINEIRRLDEMDRKLSMFLFSWSNCCFNYKQGFLTSHATKLDILMKPASEAAITRTRSQQEIDDMELQLNEIEKKILQMNASQETLNKRYLELTELRHVIRETAIFFEEVLFIN